MNSRIEHSVSRVSLGIEGMSCASCALRVENALATATSPHFE